MRVFQLRDEDTGEVMISRPTVEEIQAIAAVHASRRRLVILDGEGRTLFRVGWTTPSAED